jgi:molybdopterin/thiamine biosynthesis adenylyltransferase
MSSAHQFAHRFLLEKGLIRIPSCLEYHRYEGVVSVKGVSFPIEVSFNELDFIEFPKYKLLRIPDGLSSNLPHVEPDGNLCYLDKELIYLDRYNPDGNFVLCFQCVEKLLLTYVQSNDESFSQDYAAEFCSYWQGEHTAYIKSWTAPLLAMIFDRRSELQSINNKSNKEIVIFHNNDEAQSWLKIRNSIENVTKTTPVIVVKLTKTKLIKLFETWPLSSRQELLKWLISVDQAAAQSLISNIAKMATKNNSMYVVLQTPGGNVGAYISFEKHIIEALKRSKNRHTKRNKPAQPKEILLRSSVIQGNFFRVDINDASDNRIYTRNQENELTFIGKKIALVGCGTVGSFTALLLSQLGAGIKDHTHKGALALYDHDILQPDNLGRHVLNLSYVGENKALAMVDFLTKQANSSNINFIGNANKFDAKKLSHLSGYDLIIDATGNESFSTALSHYYHKSSGSYRIIYGWVIAGGKAVRAMIDDRSGACYRCLRVSNNNALLERFNVFPNGKEPPEPIRRNCGNAYFPYASSASVSAAGLIQQLAIDSFSGNPSPRFRHISLSPDVIHTKNSNPTRLENCPCCNKTS